MAKVFPELMDKLDANDMGGSLRTVEDYIHYMTERMEFSMTNTTRMATESGMTGLATMELLAQLTNTVASLASTVNGMRGDVNAVQAQLKEMEATIQGLEEAIQKLDERVTALEPTE